MPRPLTLEEIAVSTAFDIEPFPAHRGLDPIADLWLKSTIPDAPIESSGPVSDLVGLEQHPFWMEAKSQFKTVFDALDDSGKLLPDKILPSTTMRTLCDSRHLGIGNAWTFNYSLSSRSLLGGGYEGSSWDRWREFLSVVDGNGAWKDPAFCRKCLGLKDSDPIPTTRPDEIWMVVGRRGGKTAVAAGMALTLALARWESRPGEKVRVLLQGAVTDRTKGILDYISGMLNDPVRFPGLSDQILIQRKDSIELVSGTVVEVQASNEQSARGMSYAAAICDEVSQWAQSSGQYARGQVALRDESVIGAIRPALALTGGPLIALSTPYLRRGEMWNTYKRHFGRPWDKTDGRRIMVWQASSLDMHPGSDSLERTVNEAYDTDKIKADIEYGAQFAAELNEAVSRTVVEGAVEAGCVRRPHNSKFRYVAFLDAAEGAAGGDSAAFAVAHVEGSMTVLDLIEFSDPPFNPAGVISRWRDLARTYDCAWVYSDQFIMSAHTGWLRLLQEVEFKFLKAPRNTSGNFYDLILLLQAGRVKLLDNFRLVNELAGLERHEISSRGYPVIQHRPGEHDDVATAAAGALNVAAIQVGASIKVGRTG